MTDRVVVVDIGMGNVGSVANMLRKVGADAQVSSDPAVVSTASSLILPGVGSFDSAMSRIRERGLEAPLRMSALDRRVPVLGICLGMQLLAEESEEGSASGLGWIPGSVRRLPTSTPSGAGVKVPHMGWGRLQVAPGHEVLERVDRESRFYFVHSFAFEPADSGHVAATAIFAERPFCAAVRDGNLVGVQFHPEKSHRHGLAMMRSFVGWAP